MLSKRKKKSTKIPSLPVYFYPDKTQLIGLAAIFVPISLGLTYVAFNPSPRDIENGYTLAFTYFLLIAAVLSLFSLSFLWRYFKKIPCLSLLPEGIAFRYNHAGKAKQLLPWKYIQKATPKTETVVSGKMTSSSRVIAITLKDEAFFRQENQKEYDFWISLKNAETPLLQDGNEIIMNVDIILSHSRIHIAKIISHYAQLP